MRRYLLILFSLAGLVLIFGCQAAGPKFSNINPPQPDKVVIYFYRPFNMMGGSDIPKIVDNGQEVLWGLPLRNWWRYETAPGAHTFKAEAPLVQAPPLVLGAETAGSVHFIRVEYEFGVPYAFRLVEVPEKTATAELAELFQVKEE